MTRDLTHRRCAYCAKGTPALTDAEAAAFLSQVHSDWQVESGRLRRRFEVKGYAPALMLVNAAAFLAEREDHHPDIAFGWGWVEVTYWTHTVGGLSENDFICAAKLDVMVEG